MTRLENAVFEFVDAMLEVRWASETKVKDAQRMARDMVSACRYQGGMEARELLAAYHEIVIRANESREALGRLYAAKRALIEALGAGR